MSKKTFQFDAIGKKFEVKCDIGDKEHNASCPVVGIYRAGIDTKVVIPIEEPHKIAVRLAESMALETTHTMFDIGKCVCANCRFNAGKGKVR